MTKIKLCGLSRREDIGWANEIRPDYIGFVFAGKSSRYVKEEQAESLKKLLRPDIRVAGVFVDEDLELIDRLMKKRIIDVIQLHGQENEAYIRKLRSLTDAPVIKAFQVRSREDIKRAESSSADYVLLDSGTGSGQLFDWKLLTHIQRPYFLAGGLTPENVGEAIKLLHPFAVDVSSGIETDGRKDRGKMSLFVKEVRKGKD